VRIGQRADDRDGRSCICSVALDDYTGPRLRLLAADSWIERNLPDLRAIDIRHLLKAVRQRIRKVGFDQPVCIRILRAPSRDLGVHRFAAFQPGGVYRCGNHESTAILSDGINQSKRFVRYDYGYFDHTISIATWDILRNAWISRSATRTLG